MLSPGGRGLRRGLFHLIEDHITLLDKVGIQDLHLQARQLRVLKLRHCEPLSLLAERVWDQRHIGKFHDEPFSVPNSKSQLMQKATVCDAVGKSHQRQRKPLLHRPAHDTKAVTDAAQLLMAAS